MKKPINLRWFYCKVMLVILLFFTLVTISFVANAEDFSDISIPVWIDEMPEDIVIVLHKENLLDYLEIALDDEEVLSFLKGEEKKIKELEQKLADAQEKKISKKEIDELKKEIEKAEKTFKNCLSQYEKATVKIVLKARYPGPIYFRDEKYETEKRIPFYFRAEGGKSVKILIPDLKDLDLSENIEAELLVKDSRIEVIKENDKYKLIFDKTKDISIKFQGKLRGKAELGYGIKPQIDNPIFFEEKGSPVGKPFKIKIHEDRIEKSEELHVYFINKQGKTFFSPNMPLGKKENEADTHYIFRPLVPKIPKYLLGNVTVVALIIDDKGNINAYNSSKFWIVSRILAGLFAFLITSISIILITYLAKTESTRWKKAPLEFTKTPLNRYSISLLQILIWTGITIFAYLYVLFLKVECINLTNQILILLGISGGTALSAKAIGLTRCKEIPEKYFTENGKDLRKERTPKFSDYVTIGGIPNLFKLQILGFTVITGIFVLIEIIKSANFPEIPEKLLILMGISGGVYIGNETATENVWKKIEDKVKQAHDMEAKMLQMQEEVKDGEVKIVKLTGAEKLQKAREISKLEIDIEVMSKKYNKLEEETKEDIKKILM